MPLAQSLPANAKLAERPPRERRDSKNSDGGRAGLRNDFSRCVNTHTHAHTLLLLFIFSPEEVESMTHTQRFRIPILVPTHGNTSNVE